MKAQTTTRLPFLVSQSREGKMNAEQVGLVLACLASDAMVIKDMLSRCADASVSANAVGNYCSVMQALVERMAWMADTTAESVFPSSAVGLCDSPSDLFMPPSFNHMGAA